MDLKVSNYDVRRSGKSESMISENSHLLLFYYGERAPEMWTCRHVSIDVGKQ